MSVPGTPQPPTPAYVGASWAALFIGLVSYAVGLWNASMMLNEKGYYLTVLLFGLFGVISLQKSVRDRTEDIPVTPLYYGLCWVAVIASLVLLSVGLWNADLLLSEKGFYGIAFTMALFGAITVQKNVRDGAPLGTDLSFLDGDGDTAGGAFRAFRKA